MLLSDKLILFGYLEAGQPSVPSMLTAVDRHQHREPKTSAPMVRAIGAIRMGRCLARKLTMQLY